MNFKKLFAVMLMLLMVTAVYSAQDITIPDELPEGVTITYWHEWGGIQQETIDEMIATFNETNEWGITVEAVAVGGGSAVPDQVNANIVTGELPNLSGAVYGDDAQGYYVDGILVPLDPYYNHPVWGFTDEEKADLNQAILDVNRFQGEPFNGQLLSWPTGVSANVLSVNMDMLNDLGYDAPPADLATFREIACAANELEPENGDVQGFPLRLDGFDMYSFLAANGATVYDPMTMTYNFTEPAAVEVFQFFADLYADGCAYIPDGPYVNTADFAYGLNPMAVGSSVGVPFIQSDIEDSGSGIENWINTIVPHAEGNPTIQVFLRSMAIFRSTPEEQLATWLFIKYLASTEQQIYWTEHAQYIPYTASGLDGISQEFLDANPQFTSVRELLIDPDIHVWSAPNHLNGFATQNNLSEAIAAITTGGQDVESTAAELEETMNAAVAEAMEMIE